MARASYSGTHIPTGAQSVPYGTNQELAQGLFKHAEEGFVAEQLTKIWDNFRNYLILTTNKTQRETADKLGDRLASRMYSANPDLNEVRFVINTAGDYRA